MRCDHEVLLRQADGEALVARLVGRSPKITSIKFSPEGTKLAAAGGAPSLFGEIQIWDVAKRELIRSDTIGFDTFEEMHHLGVATPSRHSLAAVSGTEVPQQFRIGLVAEHFHAAIAEQKQGSVAR